MQKSKRLSTILSTCGTLTCTLSLATLLTSILTTDWLQIQEPTLDLMELEKLGPYDEEPKPEVLKAKIGLLKICTQLKQKSSCVDFDFLKFFNDFELFVNDKADFNGSELVLNCVNKMRLTLPFILLSLIFTTLAFLSQAFGHFCQKNKKIVEASNLILAGLCEASALLTFVSQIGSEFESNSSSQTSSLIKKHYLLNFFRYKYGYSFYLFLLSFSLAELAALLDMAAYFRKNSNNSNNKNDQILNGSNYYGCNDIEMDGTEGKISSSHPDICQESGQDFIFQHHHQQSMIVPPPQSYLSPEVVVIANNPAAFCTVNRNQQQQCRGNNQNNCYLESFATLRGGQQACIMQNNQQGQQIMQGQPHQLMMMGEMQQQQQVQNNGNNCNMNMNNSEGMNRL